MADAVPARTPLYRDVRALRVLGQAVFVVLMFLLLRELYLNLRLGFERQGVDLSFDFLAQRAGFGIRETSWIEYTPNHSFWRALQAGIANTIRAAAVGIAIASLLGLVIGVARLSSNWLVRKLAQVYVEFFRNTPLLVQVFFWYFAVVLTLPPIDGGISLADAFFLSNRGAAVPWFRAVVGVGTWVVFLAVGAIAAFLVRRWRTRVFDRTGKRHYRFLWTAGTFLVVAAVGYVAAGDPLRLDVPESTGRGYEGGILLSPEYAALTIGLVVYTAAFIAEIVRGSILAVAKGQKEAAEALGLTPVQQLRFVVIPQAMRIAIPPINSQYQNLTKNTTLGTLVAYPELLFVVRTISNQAGRATQVLLIAMASYLMLTLTISFLMNMLNRAVALRGERR